MAHTYVEIEKQYAVLRSFGAKVTVKHIVTKSLKETRCKIAAILRGAHREHKKIVKFNQGNYRIDGEL